MHARRSHVVIGIKVDVWLIREPSPRRIHETILDVVGQCIGAELVRRLFEPQDAADNIAERLR